MRPDFLGNFIAPLDLRLKGIVEHILYAAGLKVINAGISFIIIPLYLQYLTEVSFGIWLTVSAVLNWFNFLDLGMGNGLRNRFAEARAAGNTVLAQTYVSTTYALLALISAGILLLFLGANSFFNWSTLFAAPASLETDVNRMVVVLVVLFCPQFCLQLIKMIVTADQKPAFVNMMNTIGNVLQLSGLFALSLSDGPALWKLALLMGGINLLVPLLANLVLFRGRYRNFSPSFSSIDFTFSKDLLGLGFAFFVMQGAALVVFMTDNLIITHVLGPEEVPAYNIAFRYFNLLAVFFALITTPFWSAFTEAFQKKDILWITVAIKRLLGLWGGACILGIVMYFLAPSVYNLWIGQDVEIPQLLNAMMALWVLASSGLSIFGIFLSGIGVLRLSLYHSIVVMVLNIPLSIYLAGFAELGSAGVIMASFIGMSLRFFFQPLQVWKLVKGRAEGVWRL